MKNFILFQIALIVFKVNNNIYLRKKKVLEI